MAAHVHCGERCLIIHLGTSSNCLRDFAYNAVELSLGFVAKRENFAFEIGFSLLGWGTGLNIEVFHVAGCICRIWHNMGLDVGGLRATRADQRLCCWVCRNYDILTCYEQGFDILAALSSWWDLFGSRFFVGPECWFCLEEAHML